MRHYSALLGKIVSRQKVRSGQQTLPYSNILQVSRSCTSTNRDISCSLLSFYSSSAHICTKKVPALSDNWLCIANVPCYTQRHWVQEMRCQNAMAQLTAWLGILSSLNDVSAGVNFCIRYQHSPVQILSCDWLWLEEALLLNLIR